MQQARHTYTAPSLAQQVQDDDDREGEKREKTDRDKKSHSVLVVMNG
jgi:hypothetical protein